MKKIIDISHHQGSIDFSKVKDEVEFIIIRVQYGSSSIDKKYKEYIAGCKKYGIPFGLYAYARFMSKNDAIIEAKDFLSRADKEAKFLVVDVEEQTTPSKNEMLPATQAYIDTLKNAGIEKVGLYTGHHFYKPYAMDKVKADFLWIPRYGGPKPDFACDLWQFTDSGKVNGISSNVDTNLLNGSKDVAYFTGKKKTIAAAKPSNLPVGILKLGDKGAEVKKLQNALNALNFKCGEVDGVFGKDTLDALERFQSVYVNPVDGIYGKDTKAALSKLLK